VFRKNMGLTIQYKISTQRRLTLAGVKQLLEPLRQKALALGFETVGELLEVGPDYTWACHIPRDAKTAADVLMPLEGWVFHADPGEGSESAQLGLCRYEGVSGWRLRGFCKTQYAANHGWEHFLKCHRSVVELLWAAEDLKLRVNVHDEGELFETGSDARLRRNLEKYNRCLAAFGGALKDAAGASGVSVQSAIHGHPDFERLEAAGMASYGRQVDAAVMVVKKLASDSAFD
jgi:hypothetical protein